MIAVAERNGHVTLLGPGSETTEAAAEDLSGAKLDSWNPGPCRSLAWRILAAARVAQSGEPGFDWDPGVLRSAAQALASRSIESSRLFALDALEKGDEEALSMAPLPSSERTWLRAILFSRTQPGKALLDLAKLPAEGFPAKVLVLARCWSSVPRDDQTRTRLRQQLEPFRDDPLTNLLWRLLGGEEGELSEWAAGATAMLQLFPEGEEILDVGRNLLAAIGEDRDVAGVDFGLIGPAATVFARWKSLPIASASAPVDVPRALMAPWSVIDDLIDGGVLTREALPELTSLPPEARRYLVARLAPDELGDEDLELLQFDRERLRRAFLRSDSAALEASEDGDGRLFLFLHRLRSGNPEVGQESLGLLGSAPARIASSLVRFISEPSVDALYDDLLSDRSVWPTLSAVLNRRRLDLGDRSHLSEPKRRFLEWNALNEARAHLYEWDWEGALDHAKRCLHVSENEAVRDEALNLLACAHYGLGRDLEAIRALETALKDDYSAALQANIGVVAASLEPRTAAAHLGRLVVDAPTLELRVAAAKRAIALWRSAPEPWEQDEDSDEVLPSILRDALRSLVPESLRLEDFRLILKLLAHWDAEWLSESSGLKASPHKDSLEAVLYRALADGYPEFIKALANAIGKNPNEKWLLDERDGLVDAAIRAVIEDEPSVGAAFFGVQILEAGMPLEVDRRIPLVAFSVAALTANIDPDEGEPKEKFLDWLISATNERGSLSSENRERCEGALGFAFNAIGHAIGAAREKQLSQVIDAYGTIAGRLQGTFRWNVNRDAVRGATDPLLDFTSDTRRILNKLLPFIADEDLKTAIQSVEEKSAQVEAAIRQLPR